jgi:hypothetical protein
VLLAEGGFNLRCGGHILETGQASLDLMSGA